MVGLVIVSHSRALANALANLVKQGSSSNISVAISARVGNDRQEFGTDAVEISEAIQSVLGIMTVGGGPTSHSAILARALGIPTVSSVSQELARAPLGSLIALDGFNGTI
jgi:dihydroxyacetone kinase DhaKLM complex PTS-EIIA-like component DhaM